MTAVITLLTVLTLSVIVTRIATVALLHTGLSREAAQFQARSAFTGVGFTTTEAESVVNHPVRRRVVMLLMLVGNAGIVSVIASLLLTDKRNKRRSATAEKHSSVVSPCDDKAMGPFTDVT